MKQDFLAVDEARRRIFSQVEPIAARESVSVRDALGRICAQDITSPIDVPGHSNSAMDGYALASAALGGGGRATLRVLGRSMAGTPYFGALGADECVKIMTGAVIPSGCDAVVPKEDVLADEGGHITVDAGKVRKNQHLRFPGEDLKRGEVAVAKGKWMRAAEVGLVASLGVGEVGVVRRPRIAFFSTGDELRSIGASLEQGQIYDSNRYTIHAMVRRLGFDPVDLGVVPDDLAALQDALGQASGADAIITSGGVSVGEADHVKTLLERNGSVVFWKVAMKPGRPLAFGRVGNALFFGLPGNPVSVMVTFYMVVQTALWKLAGRLGVPPPAIIRARAGDAMRKAPGRIEYQRCVLETADDGELLAYPTGEQGSGILRSMSAADALAVLDADSGDIEAGGEVKVLPLEGIV